MKLGAVFFYIKTVCEKVYKTTSLQDNKFWESVDKKGYVSIIWIRGDNDLEVVWKMYCKKKDTCR